jgi:hypothetical protein
MLGTGMKALDKSMKRYRRCFRKLKKPMTKVSDRQMVEVEAQSEANSSDALQSTRDDSYNKASYTFDNSYHSCWVHPEAPGV